MGLLAASDAGDALVVGIGRGAVLWRAGTATTLRGADDERCVAVAISGDGTRMAYGAWPWKGYDGGMGYLDFTENDWSKGLVRVFDARLVR